VPSPTASASTDAPQIKRFLLEVNPAAAHIAVDGVSAQVLAGRVAIEGAVGSVHTVRVTFAGRSSDQRIAIAHDGLVPSRVNMPPVAQPPEHVNPPENSAPKTDDKATISAAPTAAPSAGLSSIFE
jgi:hypothetical protein